MEKIEPRIYEIEITFDEKGVNLDKFCRELSIKPENCEQIQEDDWGICGRLEIWFQEVRNQQIKLHIQKKHFIHDRKYLEELNRFFQQLNQLEYVREIKDTQFLV